MRLLGPQRCQKHLPHQVWNTQTSRTGCVRCARISSHRRPLGGLNMTVLDLVGIQSLIICHCHSPFQRTPRPKSPIGQLRPNRQSAVRLARAQVIDTAQHAVYEAESARGPGRMVFPPRFCCSFEGSQNCFRGWVLFQAPDSRLAQ